VEWRRKRGYTYQVDRLETQQYIQDVFEKAENTISVSGAPPTPLLQAYRETENDHPCSTESDLGSRQRRLPILKQNGGGQRWKFVCRVPLSFSLASRSWGRGRSAETTQLPWFFAGRYRMFRYCVDEGGIQTRVGSRGNPGARSPTPLTEAAFVFFLSSRRRRGLRRTRLWSFER